MMDKQSIKANPVILEGIKELARHTWRMVLTIFRLLPGPRTMRCKGK
ncbi:hypothetical protein ES703_105135 [subsurface metagenome]